MPASSEQPEIAHALDRLAEAIVITDSAGVGAYINPAARELLGALPAFDATVPVRQIDWGEIDSAGNRLGPDELPSELTRITGQELSAVEIGVPSSSGALRWLRVNTRRLGDQPPPCTVISSYIDVTARRELREELQTVRDRHVTMVEALNHGVVLHDATGTVIEHNAQAAAVVGLTPRQLRREGPMPEGWAAVDERRQPLARDQLPLATALRTGEPQLGRVIGVRVPAGYLRWLSVSVTPLWDPEQGVRGAVTTVADISEQRAAEAARREADERIRTAEASRAAATQLFETAFTSAPMGLMLIGLDMKVIRVNERLCEMLGRPAEELLGAEMRTFTHPDDLDVTAGAWQHLQRAGTPISVQKRYLRPDGTVVWAQTYGRTVAATPEQPGYIISHLFDITERKQAELRHAEMAAQFEAAFSDGPIGMAVVGLDGRWIRVNRMLCELLGYSETELLERTFQDITAPDDLDSDLELVRQLLAGEIERYTMQKRYLTAAGGELWATLAVSLVRDPDGRPLHFISQIEDISDRKRLEAELRHQADHDPLTEIWNRRRFDEALEQQVLRSQRYGETAALLSVDLNGFKAINDRNGHGAGDEVLRAVARALRSRLRGTDGLARVGGDEFAVLLANVTEAQARALADELRETIAQAAVLTPGGPLRVTASIGVAVIDAQSQDRAEVLAQADAAMYWHKQSEPAVISPGRPD